MSAAGTSRETPRIATVNLRRRVAMESGMCRSGAQRQDGRVEDVRERQTLGRERRNAVLRGNRQKAVSRDAEGGVMVEAAPAAAFEMPEPRPPASAPDIRARCASAALASSTMRSKPMSSGRASLPVAYRLYLPRPGGGMAVDRMARGRDGADRQQQPGVSGILCAGP